jgi:cell division protein FtsB
MVWTTSAKRKYYYERKKAAYKFASETATLFGMSKKTAIKKVLKQFTKEYKRFKTSTRRINSLEKQISRLNAKPKLNKGQQKKLSKLVKEQNKLTVKSNQRWNEYQIKIGYKSAGEVDDSRRKY